MPDNDQRRNQLLDSAASVIIRVGYDKTSMNDIAEEAGVSRGTLYLYFKTKDEMFEALIYRDWLQYVDTWLSYVEADPRGGTFGGIYRATFRAIDTHPMIASMMRRDRRVIGNYLRKPDNLFAWMKSGAVTSDFIRALQAAGAVRSDVDAATMTHVIDMLSYGYLSIEDIKSPADFPPDEAVLETVAEMLDRMLTPEDGGSSEAGKAVIRQIANAAKTQLEQMKQIKDRGGSP